MINWKKNICKLSIILIAVVCSLLICKTSSYAYTQEEKEAAKAWLIANGYSPDWGGANAAYQDYLNGKWGGPGGNNNNDNNDEQQPAEGEQPADGQAPADGAVETPATEVVTAPEQTVAPKVEEKPKEDMMTKEEAQESFDGMMEMLLDGADELEENTVRIEKTEYEDMQKQLEEQEAQMKALEEANAQKEAERLAAEAEVQKTRELVEKRRQQVMYVVIALVVVAAGAALILFKKKNK